MFTDSTTKTNIENWRHASDVTTIDGGDIYTSSITASKINVSDFINFPSDENLVGYWSFDEGSGTFAVDGSGNGNNGTLANMDAAAWIAGISGTGLDFDGSNDYVALSNALTIFSSSFTISMWAYFDDDTRGILLGDYGLASAINVNFERYTSNRLRLYWDGSPDIFTGTNAVNTGSWNFVSVVRDKTAEKVYFYVDGELVHTYSGALSDKTATIPHRIGSDSRTGTTVVDGKIDEVRIYDSALTASEIKALYLYPAGNKSVKISGGQIEADSITATQIQAGSITANELVLNQGQYWYSKSSTTTRNSNDTEQSTLSGSYVKIKETKINEATGIMKVYFELKTLNPGVPAYAKIYKNGSPVGTERSEDTGAYTPFSEDLSEACDEDDLIQIYAYRDGAGRAYVRNMRFQYDRAVTIVAGAELATPLTTVGQTAFSMTNQDP